MFALIAAFLFVLAACGVDHFGAVAVFYLALASWACHFAFTVAIPFPRRQP